MLTTTFIGEKERAKAFAVYGAISGGGAAIGLLLGGVLTQYVDWRWCLLVNIPIALIAIAAAVPIVKETKAHGDTSYDLPGAVLIALGLGSLVYGFTRAEHGWGQADTLLFIALGLVFLAIFVVVESRSKNPLLPLSVPWHRDRGAALIGSMLVGAALLGGTLYLTFYLQIVLGFSPVMAGVGSLPMAFFIVLASTIAAQLSTKIGPKPLMVAGPLVAAVGLLMLTQIEVHSSYWTHVFPGLAIFGFGLGSADGADAEPRTDRCPRPRRRRCQCPGQRHPADRRRTRNRTVHHDLRFGKVGLHRRQRGADPAGRHSCRHVERDHPDW